MSFDLAIDPSTGDLKMATNNDVGVRTGNESVEQRIRVRLRIRAGLWHLDPTNGQLGSHLRDLTRVPNYVAETDAPRMIHEALEPMEDVVVHRITAKTDAKDARKLNITLEYSILEPTGEVTGDFQTLATSVVITE